MASMFGSQQPAAMTPPSSPNTQQADMAATAAAEDRKRKLRLSKVNTILTGPSGLAQSNTLGGGV